MKSKNKIIVGLYILSLSLIPVSNTIASTWIVYDTTDDVACLQNYVTQSTGDYHDEIDIVSYELDSSNIVYTFQDVPQIDQNHSYQVEIFWFTSQTNPNKTVGTFNSIYNTVVTWLYNSKGVEVLKQEVNDSIYITANTIIIPIPEIHLIPNTANPDHSQALSIADEGNGIKYIDMISSSTVKAEFGVNSFSSIIIITGSISIVCVIISLKRKRASSFSQPFSF
ncbi:MAG: hypothetical protein ACTSR1_04310 [Candidatus Heimdallarchaeota archaeon]